MAAGTMETQGITEGFRELNTELKTQVEVNGKLEDKYTKTEKAKATATKRKWTALLLLLGLLAAGAVSLKGCLPI